MTPSERNLPVSLPPPASPLAIGAGAMLLLAAFGTTGIIAFVRVIIGMFR